MRWPKFHWSFLPLALVAIGLILEMLHRELGKLFLLLAGVSLAIVLGLTEFMAWNRKMNIIADARARLQRQLPPRCVRCGYDLRASKERCPECGTGIPVPPLPQSPMVRRVIEHAAVMAHQLGSDYVGTEHVLLSLASEPDTVAGTLLASFGVNETELTDELRILSGAQKPAAIDPLEAPKQLTTPTSPAD